MPISFPSCWFTLPFSSWGAYTDMYFVQHILYSVCPSFRHVVWPVLHFLSKHTVSFFLWLSLCLFQFHLFVFWNVSSHNSTYWEVKILFCVLALKFAISTGSISSGVPQDCRFSGCLTLMNCHLSSDKKKTQAHLLLCVHLKKPTGNLESAAEAGMQNPEHILPV